MNHAMERMSQTAAGRLLFSVQCQLCLPHGFMQLTLTKQQPSCRCHRYKVPCRLANKFPTKGYNPSRVPTSKMNRAPSRRYRASVAGSSPSDWDGVWAKSFLSQYQHGLMWSRVAGSFLSQNKMGLMRSRVSGSCLSR